MPSKDIQPTVKDVIIAHSRGENVEYFLGNIVQYLANGQLSPKEVPNVCKQAATEQIIEPLDALNVCVSALMVAKEFEIQ